MIRALITAVALFCPSAGLAAVICVNPAGGGACHRTIQSGVNASRQGDVIEVAAGVYFENVRIARGKGAIRLVGAGNDLTIIDPDVPNSGPAVLIEGHGAEVANLGVRNGRPYGILVAAATIGVTVRGVRLVGVRGSGERFQASVGIYAQTGCRGTRLLFNEVHAAGSWGIVIQDSPNSLVQGNRVEQAEIGIDARGDGVQVVANSVASIANTGIVASGTGARLIDNLIESGLGGGSFIASAINATVSGNQVNNAGPGLFFCSGNGLMTDNESVGAFGTPAAFHIVSSGNNCRVIGNRVVSAATVGFFIEGSDLLFTDNNVTDSGLGSNGNGFVVVGGSFARPHTLMRNVATDVADNGFRIQGGAILEHNSSHGAGRNGFAVRSQDPVVLRGNRAADSAAAGFAILADTPGTVLSGNVGTGNRYDFCDDGAGTVVSSGNEFETTSTTCDLGG